MRPRAPGGLPDQSGSARLAPRCDPNQSPGPARPGGDPRPGGTPDWTECDPAEVGMDAAALARAVELVRARHATAQLCVIRHGRVVLDRAFGCDRTSLFWMFSAGKPYTAMLVHLLAERGLLGLDDPVAAYWPRFGRHGKDRVTVRHVLAHRSGLATAGSALGDALTMTDWRLAVRRLEHARPRWPAGTVPAYQFLAYGFILGELVRRVTGRPVDELLRTELLDPLGARDTYLGLPADQWARHVPVRGGGLAGTCAGVAANRRRTRRAVIPAAGVSANARDLAAFYRMLCDGGIAGGVRVLRPGTIAAARTPSGDGQLDRYLRLPRWSHGFQLGGPRPGAATVPGRSGAARRVPHGEAGLSPMGRRSGTGAFGHNGSNCCIGWADPERDLVFAYLTDRLGGSGDVRHHAAVADTVLDACAGRP